MRKLIEQVGTLATERGEQKRIVLGVVVDQVVMVVVPDQRVVVVAVVAEGETRTPRA
jgi:hypothetical protein